MRAVFILIFSSSLSYKSLVVSEATTPKLSTLALSSNITPYAIPQNQLEHIDKNLLDYEELTFEEAEFVDDRILHCPEGSNHVLETQHNETSHATANYIFLTVIFGLFIAIGLCANVIMLGTFQYLAVSPVRALLRAELVAYTAWLVLLIPLYPIAHIYPHTGKFQLYEVAKPYVTNFFETTLDIALFCIIWTLVWLSYVRYIIIVLHNTTKSESCTVKAVRDQLRLLTCVAIVINLPKFFDTEVYVTSDPCNPGDSIVNRKPNVLGANWYYIVLYKVVLLSIWFYVLPFLWMARLTYQVHHALRRSVRPAGYNKARMMAERIGTPDAVTTELDKAILLFYVFNTPRAVFDMAKNLQIILPTSSTSGYAQAVDGADKATLFLVLVHAALAKISVYSSSYQAFRDMWWDKYGIKLYKIYRYIERTQEHKEELRRVQVRLDSERMKKNNAEHTRKKEQPLHNLVSMDNINELTGSPESTGVGIQGQSIPETMTS